LGRNFYSTCEKFGELSFKTPDLAASLSYWAKFGFECVSQQATPYSWAVVSDGLIRLGFHQTDKFSKPIITYFAPDMPKRLEGLRQAGLRLISERTDATGQPLGAAIQSPDGQPFLLFSGQISPDF
jgi:hypothetical protein